MTCILCWIGVLCFVTSQQVRDHPIASLVALLACIVVTYMEMQSWEERP